MRYHEFSTEDVLDEDINRNEWVFYHGTKSAAFDLFDPRHARSEHYWNPLGNGLYATNDPHLARQFGPNVHKVLVPPGCRYLRISQDRWMSETGRSLINRALKRAFKVVGDNFEHWDKGVPLTVNKKMSRDEVVAGLVAYYSHWGHKEPEVRAKTDAMSDDDLYSLLKKKAAYAPRKRDYEKGRKITKFRTELGRVLKLSPYECLYESHALVTDIFGPEIGEAYADVLPNTSDSTFGRYDFVVFGESNDPDEGSWEIVIFNPQLQKVRAE